jgi:serine/threonine protein kinase
VNPRAHTAASRLRILFEQVVELGPGDRTARLSQLNRNDPDAAQLLRLIDAHDHATGRLGRLEFLRAPGEGAGRASAFDAAAAFAPNYTIERQLAGGGMSHVFLARDAKLGRGIVLKVLPPELAAEVSTERFRREIHLAAQLRHPHIVPLLETGEAAGSLYYTMPFIEGESLRDLLKHDITVPISVALRFAAEIAEALEYAHGLGVIHRDIKPENILVDAGHAVVTDFGIARALSHAVDSTITHPGTVIGTPAYMSPEQASPQGVIDARTDIYSLGCVLHEMLYGSPPFGGVVAFTPAERAASVRVPARVRAIIARAMAARSADRFQSAQAMREALMAEAGPRFGRRVVWTTIAALVVLIVGARVALQPATDHSFASPQAVVKRLTTRGDVRLAAISPGGAYVAFVSKDTSLRVSDVGAGTQGIISTGLRLGPKFPWSIRQLSWSPDGSLLYFSPEPPHTVTVIPKLGPWRTVIANPLLAGPVRDVWSGWQWASGFALSPLDSSSALFLVPMSPTEGRAVIVHLPGDRGGRIDTIDVRNDMQWAMISFSPNGRWLAACGGARNVATWRVALFATNGATQTLLDSNASFAPSSCGVIWSARGDSLHVWPKPPGTGMVSYGINDASGTATGPPTPFRLPQAPAGVRTAFSLSADQRRLAYVEHALRQYVAVVELGAGIEVPLREADVAARDPRRPEISSGGDRFAYVITSDSGSAIYTQDLRGGEPRRLSREYREGLSGVRWSDDAMRIATLTRRDSQTVILILDAAGTEVMTVRPKHAVYDTSLFRPSYDWAARNTGIMYNTVNLAKRRPEVWLIDLASGQERRLLATEDGSSSTYLSLPVWSPDGKSILYDSYGNLIVKDVATGTKRAVMGKGVPLRWRADGTFFSERLNRDGTTSIWRSSVSQSPTLYAHLGSECKLISMDRAARRAVCHIDRDESDVFVVTRP